MGPPRCVWARESTAPAYGVTSGPAPSGHFRAQATQFDGTGSSWEGAFGKLLKLFWTQGPSLKICKRLNPRVRELGMFKQPPHRGAGPPGTREGGQCQKVVGGGSSPWSEPSEGAWRSRDLVRKSESCWGKANWMQSLGLAGRPVSGAFLVVQWLGLCPPIQWWWVRGCCRLVPRLGTKAHASCSK